MLTQHSTVMARPHIEFIQSSEVTPEPASSGPLTGVPRRMLSADPDSGAHTALYQFPKGFNGDLAARSPLELFGLRGALRVAGQTMGPGCYAYVPSGASGARIEVDEDADVLVMVEPERPPEAETAITVIDQRAIAWHMPDENPNRALGIVIKLLREDPQTHDWTWISAVVPGWLSHRAEVHPTIEECLMLRGDILLGDRGVMHAGSYFWRPGMVEHGPMYSRDGAMFFFRTKGGRLSTTWVPVPGWEQAVETYAAGTPFYASPPGRARREQSGAAQA